MLFTILERPDHAWRTAWFPKRTGTVETGMRSRDLGLLAIWVMVTGAIWFGGCGGSSPPVISVSVTSAALLVDASGNTALTALVKGGTSNLGVTWTLSGSDCAGNSCGTLSGATATTVTYTAPKTLRVNLTVT